MHGPALSEYQSYQIAKDGSDYLSSTKEMFSPEAYEKWQKRNYTFPTEKERFLQKAEAHFQTSVLPAVPQQFPCSFCEQWRYYAPLPAGEEKSDSKLRFHYQRQSHGDKKIWFGADGSFEAQGAWDAGTGTRVFGKNAQTLIVQHTKIPHVLRRYVITDQDEEHLHTTLDIIQR